MASEALVKIMPSDDPMFPKDSPSVRPPMPGLSAIPGAPGAGNGRPVDSLDFVMDVPVELTVEIGRRRVRIAEVLRLGPGSVLELNKAAGEPLDVYVNNRLIARGEAVVVGDHYGVRLTEVVIEDGRHRNSESR